MKKLLFLAAVAMLLQVTPVLADDHEGGKEHKGKKGEMFSKHDLDGDGRISESEYLDQAKKRFDSKDKDGDGYITQEESKKDREAMKEKWKEKRGKMKERIKEKRSETKAEESAE